MLGYVKIYKPQLKMYEYETYKGFYCSLCKELGRSYSHLAPILLNYDYVFLLLLKHSLKEQAPAFSPGRCSYNPFVKCSRFKDEEFLKKCSDLIIIISYYSLKDNLSDEGGLKKLSYLIFYPVLRLMWRKARKRAGQYDRIVADAMREQAELEKQSGPSIDAVSHPTAHALGQIFSADETKSEQKKILYTLGYMLGRWVYFADAVDDIEDDIKQKNFNPFMDQFLKDENKDKSEFSDYALCVLRQSAGEATLAFELLNVKRYKGVLENILYEGLEEVEAEILNKRGKD